MKKTKKLYIALALIAIGVILSIVLQSFTEMRVSRERLFKAMPSAEITAAEYVLTETIFDEPVIKDSEKAGKDVFLPTDALEEALKTILPEKTDFVHVYTYLDGDSYTVGVEYGQGYVNTEIEMPEYNRGYITKTVMVFNAERGDEPYLLQGDSIRAVYKNKNNEEFSKLKKLGDFSA